MDITDLSHPAFSSDAHYKTVTKIHGQTEDVEDNDRPPKKPKKVNSEIRKQQNRVASRNYREKRKRKLQHLRDLVKEEAHDQCVLQTPIQEQYGQSLVRKVREHTVESTSSSRLAYWEEIRSPVNFSTTNDCDQNYGPAFEEPILPESLIFPSPDMTWNIPIPLWNEQSLGIDTVQIPQITYQHNSIYQNLAYTRPEPRPARYTLSNEPSYFSNIGHNITGVEHGYYNTVNNQMRTSNTDLSLSSFDQHRTPT